MSAIFGRLVGNEHPLVASPYIMYLRKTLAVDECKNRVTVYLNADKITDAQAEELMLLIDEVYA